MIRAGLAAAIALILCAGIPGCLFDGGEPYRLTFGKDHTISDILPVPEKVGGQAPALDGSAAYIPFAPEPEAPGDTANRDSAKPERSLPPYRSALCITAVKRYHVEYRILDADNRIAYHDRRSFGYAGELRNSFRVASRGMIGCLEWSLRSVSALYHPRYRRPGLYRWQASFSFDDPKEDFSAERAFTISEWPR